jgi:hypothetical protein
LVLESRVSSLKTKKMMNGEGGFKEIGGASGIQSLIPSSSNSSVNSHDYDSDSVGTGRSSSGTPSSNVKGPVRISSLSLVDLAGSESVKATGSTGVRQKEGQYINKSLLTLGHVVHKLSEMSSRAAFDGGGTSSSLSMMAPNEHIPYRDSKLTRLLQPSLGGNARVCIICNISPAICNLEESHNTLKFAMRAKRIRQHARITEVADEKTLLRSYREEIEELKRQLKEARQSVDDAVMEQQQQHQTKVKLINQTSTTPERASYFSTSDEEDNDDAQVLVSAIANLESLILKAGAKSNTRGKSSARSSNNSLVAMSNEDDGNDLPPNRALDVALMKAESSSSMEVVNDDGTSPPVITSDSPTTASKSSMTTPETANDEDDSSNLLIELHRIQEMLGTVMKKKRKGGGATSGGSRKSPQPTTNSAEIRTPERDAEVERLRLKLQEQEVTSTMRKADSSFLQGQLNVKDKLLNEVSVLLEALERRQLALETENRQLREDLAGAATVIEDADTERAMLEQKLAERDALVSTPVCRDEDDEQPADEDELEENFSF